MDVGCWLLVVSFWLALLGRARGRARLLLGSRRAGASRKLAAGLPQGNPPNPVRANGKNRKTQKNNCAHFANPTFDGKVVWTFQKSKYLFKLKYILPQNRDLSLTTAQLTLLLRRGPLTAEKPLISASPGGGARWLLVACWLSLGAPACFWTAQGFKMVFWGGAKWSWEGGGDTKYLRSTMPLGNGSVNEVGWLSFMQSGMSFMLVSAGEGGAHALKAPPPANSFWLCFCLFCFCWFVLVSCGFHLCFVFVFVSCFCPAVPCFSLLTT